MADDTPASIPDAAARANNTHDLEQSALLEQGLELRYIQQQRNAHSPQPIALQHH
jgi:hypothetical protein